MSGEMDQLTDLDRDILRLLTAGWHTTEQSKSRGVLTAGEIGERVAAPVETVRERLLFMETMGYVVNEENFGGDPTMTLRGIESGASSLHHMDTRYHVSEHGMKMALAEPPVEHPAHDGA